jgi:hypothetical protein
MVPSPVLLLLLASSYLVKMLAAEPYFYLHQRPRWLHLQEQLTRRGLQPRPVQPRHVRSTRAGTPAMEAPAMEAPAMEALMSDTPAFEAPAFESAAFKAPVLRSGPPMAFEPMSPGGRGGFMGDSGSRSMWMPSDIAGKRTDLKSIIRQLKGTKHHFREVFLMIAFTHVLYNIKIVFQNLVGRKARLISLFLKTKSGYLILCNV